MEEEQLQIKRPIGEKSEEFKNVFLEQMPPEKSPIKLVVIDSRTNLFEERGNDMIQLEDPSHGHVEAFHEDGIRRGSLSLKPSLDDPEFDLILLLLGLTAGSSRNSCGMVISKIPLKSSAVTIIHNLIVSSILIWSSIDLECTIGRNLSNNRLFTRNNSICPTSVFYVLTSTQA
ncbi:hypothetical protein CRG98_000148 [Punica granatum]|uniref:Uncharacterized protein n=1 Tax=Punica granatum TaxID=22663 RepID=A0A2I0LFI8_PUNGR|nr:hypothetical protein CRG98_000148 [Punica granatum]